jgi:hypothetical protein
MRGVLPARITLRVTAGQHQWKEVAEKNRRMQVNPGGNRRLNWALHIVALVRLRMDGGRSKRLFDKLQKGGKTKRSALRLLKTYIARELFRALRQTHLSVAPRFCVR